MYSLHTPIFLIGPHQKILFIQKNISAEKGRSRIEKYLTPKNYYGLNIGIVKLVQWHEFRLSIERSYIQFLWITSKYLDFFLKKMHIVCTVGKFWCMKIFPSGHTTLNFIFTSKWYKYGYIAYLIKNFRCKWYPQVGTVIFILCYLFSKNLSDFPTRDATTSPQAHQ